MELERVVGSVIIGDGPRPFVLHVQSGQFDLGSYARPDAAQQSLSVIQLQRFAQLVQERAGVGFAQVRIGDYFCTHCRQWVAATPEQWSLSMCLSCSMDRDSELAERYREQAAEAPPQPEDAPEEAALEAVIGLDEAGWLERAVLLAVEAHRGQRDKAGAPYILHPLRMMLRMETPHEMMAAVLHDVVEDSGWTLDGLRREGFPEAVLEAVECLTRRRDESYEAFIERTAQHPLARRVKRADLEDNMDLRRLGPLTERDQDRLARYQQAWQRLREAGA